jgi:Flp pilus assembly secretin CpaC
MSLLEVSRRWRAFGVATLIAWLCAAPALADAPGEGPLVVSIDRATIIKMPDRATTIVVGNPLIADVSVQSGGLLVITGKGYGQTNLVALDRSGATLMEKAVLVRGPGDQVVVYRGIQRESYSCAPKCEPRVTLGDAQAYFDGTLAQVTVRNAQAQGGAPAQGGGQQPPR